MHIFCDFDGTITLKDTTDVILNRFAAPEWEAIEQEWIDGHIGSAECMQRQVALIHATQTELDEALDRIEIDETFPDFVRFTRSINARMSIVSDGVNYFIERILSREGLSGLPIIANHLTVHPDSTYALHSPYSSPLCESKAGVCKCRSVERIGAMRVYVGDGRSDFCAANKADMVFAKGTLAEFCKKSNIPFIPYDRFADVQAAIKQIIPAMVPQNTASVHAFV